MDDEAIGCGGAVLRHREVHAPVAVVYLTDGALGDARLADPSTSHAEATLLCKEIKRVRRLEAQAWCAAADVERVDFLDIPDGQLGRHAEGAAVARLAAIFTAWHPSLIYLPSPLDVHPDHRATNRLALAALRSAGLERQVILRGYEVWTPVLANAVMDITAVASTKARLLRLHASQLRDIDYERHILALNAYRSLLLPDHEGHAEAFVELAPRPYAALLASSLPQRATL